MSRWLSSVGNLLEQLDGRAETVAEDLAVGQELDEQSDDVIAGGPISNGGAGNVSTIDSILAKRGLSFNGGEDPDDADLVETIDENYEDTHDANMADFSDNGFFDESETGESEKIEETNEVKAPAEESEPGSSTPQQDPSESASEQLAGAETKAKEESNDAEDQPGESEKVQETSSPETNGSEEQADASSQNGSTHGEQAEPQNGAENVAESENNDSEEPEEEEQNESSLPKPDTTPTDQFASPQPPASNLHANPKPPKETSPVAPPPPSPSKFDPNAIPSFLKKELADARSFQKEARTLRRHVVSLNSQLEAAEAELDAQRVELEQAAKRMTDDQRKLKEARETAKTKHASEISAMQQSHKAAMKDLQMRMEEQVESARQKIREMEQQRMQEGGDWNKELAQAIEREEELNNKLASIEDEKNTLLNQISTMQSQQAALGSRLESLSQTADNAMEREREAEDRLDSALSLHAKQIAQRQARETELERTVQELGAALVLAQKPKSSNRENSDTSLEEDGSSALDGIATLKARLESLTNDLETANANLALERERTQTLHSELRDMSKESTQEASAVHARQVHYDRQIADLTLTISKLEANLQEAKSEISAGRNGKKSIGSSDDENAKQVKLLSEEVLRLRDKIGNYNSEILAMRNRLQTTSERAERAEEDLSKALTKSSSSDSLDNMELASGMNRRRRGNGNGPSIRSAMQLNPGQGDRRERIGKAMDAIDSFAASSGKFLRRNPFARAGFILYLLLIHLWTFILLFFHTHSFESGHGDFGAGMSAPHGPHALMQQPALTTPAIAAAGAQSPP